LRTRSGSRCEVRDPGPRRADGVKVRRTRSVRVAAPVQGRWCAPGGRTGPGRARVRASATAVQQATEMPSRLRQARSCVLWVPESRRTPRDLLILVDDAAASVTAPDLGGLGSTDMGEWMCGSSLPQGSVRAMIVVVARELAEHGRGLSLIDDQDVVEQLARTAPRRRSAIALARRGCRGGAGTRCRRGRNRWRGSRGPARTGTVARSGRTVEARDRGRANSFA
jgi:hypothetical protein